MSAGQEVRNRIIEKLLRKKVTGSHKKQVDTVVNWLASSDQGQAKQEIEEMVADPGCPLERYGGSRDNIRLSSISGAVKYLKENGGNLPFNFD